MAFVDIRTNEKNSIVELVVSSHTQPNLIDFTFIQSLGKAVDFLEQNMDRYSGVVLSSSDEKSFISGANLQELFFNEIHPPEEILKKFTNLMTRLSRINLPAVAILKDQEAAGGGFEFLLRCCDVIISSGTSSYSLPEVHLGLVPACGSIFMMIREIGVDRTINLVFRGRSARGKDVEIFKRIKVIHASKRPVDEALEQIQNLKGKTKTIEKICNETYCEDKFHEHYQQILDSYTDRANLTDQRPWLKAIIELIKLAITEKSIDTFTEKNIRIFTELLTCKNTKNKIDFFLMKNFIYPRRTLPYEKEAKQPKEIGIIGCGLMGKGIAQVAADRGIVVHMLDVKEEITLRAIEKIRETLNTLVKKNRWTEDRLHKCMENIRAVKSIEEIANVPLVIEAVYENLELKKDLLGKLHKINPDIIFASNTSSLPIREIAQASAIAENVVGMHFFSPVPLMELLEIIKGEKTSKVTLNTAFSLGRRLGKTPIVVGDGAGFYTSRVFSRFLYGGFFAIQAGANPFHVDSVAVKAGFPRGPLHMFCSVGGMVPYHAGKFMEKVMPGRMTMPKAMETVVKAGYVGAGGEKGFYKDEAGRIPDESVLSYIYRDSSSPTPDDGEIADILLLGMVNEAFWIYDEGLLDSIESMEIGAVLGIGFPDCYHGPARYLSMVGVSNFIKRINHLYEKFKIPSFNPAPSILKMEASGVETNII